MPQTNRLPRPRHTILALVGLLLLGACVPSDPRLDGSGPLAPQAMRQYGSVRDGDVVIPAVPSQYLTADTMRQIVPYTTDEAPGTIIVDPYAHRLYLILEDGQALRYTVAVGEAGRNFSGRATIPFKREWPTWTPTANMLRRDPELNEPWRGGMPGGLDNPLGARALYLYRGGRDTLYRIHGTPYPGSVGQSVSSGCIRLFQQDIIHLYDQVAPGTKVIVLSAAQASSVGTVSVEAPFAVAFPD
ncbi:MAG: L,D-transpeptidase [Qingshengfaniella sp.]